ncbi:MAG: teichoic acid ABC transporter ATP-binding protein [Deltaproteobacteria bacterium RBG_13_43_22]|nr:MAG: teichoic acid ABC transporter ATP-binding protein [Deltaproteobacteria bacterium RBG_13_43_22]
MKVDKVNPLIEFDNVSVRYRLPHEKIASLKEYAIRRLKKSINYIDFWALREINFKVYQGELVGIIGSNGAGKSTLLKVISRVLRPTLGSIRVRGLVAPLLELGAGFDYELTGRENIYLNGTILGFKVKDISKRFDRIVDFAGIKDFIDSPLRTYSTGMITRLGFAIATDIKPDILVLDEIFAVGDEEFQKKSIKRIERFKSKGTTILLVSHNLNQVKSMCEKVVWLEGGITRAVGPSKEVIEKYQRTKR